MRLQTLEAVFRALNEADVRYLVAGGVEVFSLTSDAHPETTVDLFVREPFDVASTVGRAKMVELAPGVEMPLVPIETLIRMKEAAGRPRDQDDVERLRWILEDRGGEDAP